MDESAIFTIGSILIGCLIIIIICLIYAQTNVFKEKNDALNELTKLRYDYNDLLKTKNDLLEKNDDRFKEYFICNFLWEIYASMSEYDLPKPLIRHFKHLCHINYDIDFIDLNGVPYDIRIHDVIDYDDVNTYSFNKGKVKEINVPGYKLEGKIVRKARITIYK